MLPSYYPAILTFLQDLAILQVWLGSAQSVLKLRGVAWA